MDALDFLYVSRFVTVMIILIDTAQSVPPEYCLHKLNVSDCNGPPTPVAYYYKSGSRCVIAIWRGCPTLNKFRDEVICSHICISKIMHWSDEDLMVTSNKTESAESVNKIEDWEKEIELVPSEELQVIDEMLDNVTDVLPNKIKLKEPISTTAPEEVEETTVEAHEETSPAKESETETTTVESETQATTAESETEAATEVSETEAATEEPETEATTAQSETEATTAESETEAETTTETTTDKVIGDAEEVIMP